jgi:DNA-binding transcriptional MerR regulator
VFSIQQLEQLTNLKAATVRMWEQRYAPFTPLRTPKNQRQYTESDVHRALYLALLTRHHYKISDVAACSLAALTQQAAPLLESPTKPDQWVDGLLINTLEKNLDGFSLLLSSAINTYGGPQAIEQAVLPYLTRLQGIGGRDLTGLGHLSFVLTHLAEYFLDLARQQPLARSHPSRRYILFLPVGEVQEVYLQLARYLLTDKGSQVTYLGANISGDLLQQVYQEQQPSDLVTFLTKVPPLHQVQRYVDELIQTFPKARFLLGGDRVVGQDLILPSQAQLVTSVLQLAK